MPVYETPFDINASPERGRVSVAHVEDVHGFFAPVFGVLMGSAVQKSHDALNEVLRVRAEARNNPSRSATRS